MFLHFIYVCSGISNSQCNKFFTTSPRANSSKQNINPISRDRQTDRQTETETQRQTDRKRQRQRERERGQRKRETETNRHGETEREQKIVKTLTPISSTRNTRRCKLGSSVTLLPLSINN